MTEANFLGEPMVTAQQLADHLQISVQTVWAHVRKGEWPHWKSGPRTVRFTADHVAQILSQHDQQPAPVADAARRRGRRRITD